MSDHETPHLQLILKRLEDQLETPVIPGELVEWLQTTERLLSYLRIALPEESDRRHENLLSEIGDEDPGLIPRVEKMRIEDRRIVAEAERQLKIVSAMSQHSASLEPAEARAKHGLENIISDGLQLVIRIRKQEAAIETWYLEAFDRDRGVAD